MDNAPHVELTLSLLQAANRVEHRLDRALSGLHGVSLRESRLLAALELQPGKTATRVDLAEAVGLTPSGVTRALRPLEKLGYVETQKDDRDARRSLAKLTRHGVTLVGRTDKVIRQTVAASPTLSNLEPEAGEALLHLVRDLANVG